jgi:hypothetical protein
VSDLIESRISEIREALEAAKPGPDRVGGFASQRQAVEFVEALLAEREGMKAEIERLRDDVSEKHPQISDTLHRQMPCGEVDAANRANGTASVGLPHSAEVAASHSCPICGRIAPEHDVGCPVNLYVRRLSASLDPSSAPSETLVKLRDLIGTYADASFDCGEWDEDNEDETYDRVYDRLKKARADVDDYFDHLKAARSPDREAGSGMDEVPSSLRNRMAALLMAIKHDVEWWEDPQYGRRREFAAFGAEADVLLAELVGKSRLAAVEAAMAADAVRASSHPVPSEGGGE